MAAGGEMGGHLSPIALDPPFPARAVTLLTREGAYQTAANRAFTHLTHECVRAHLSDNLYPLTMQYMV